VIRTLESADAAVPMSDICCMIVRLCERVRLAGDPAFHVCCDAAWAEL
jgi:hypothetical protein